jgi:hypothetical protein
MKGCEVTSWIYIWSIYEKSGHKRRNKTWFIPSAVVSSLSLAVPVEDILYLSYFRIRSAFYNQFWRDSEPESPHYNIQLSELFLFKALSQALQWGMSGTSWIVDKIALGGYCTRYLHTYVCRLDCTHSNSGVSAVFLSWMCCYKHLWS